MKEIKVKDKKYHILKNHKNAIDIEILTEKLTEYFDSYDYIVGDWAYGKLRLKGFNNENNPNFKSINDINTVDEYLKKNCAFACSYFIIAKIND